MERISKSFLHFPLHLPVYARILLHHFKSKFFLSLSLFSPAETHTHSTTNSRRCKGLSLSGLLRRGERVRIERERERDAVSISHLVWKITLFVICGPVSLPWVRDVCTCMRLGTWKVCVYVFVVVMIVLILFSIRSNFFFFFTLPFMGSWVLWKVKNERKVGIKERKRKGEAEGEGRHVALHEDDET